MSLRDVIVGAKDPTRKDPRKRCEQQEAEADPPLSDDHQNIYVGILLGIVSRHRACEHDSTDKWPVLKEAGNNPRTFLESQRPIEARVPAVGQMLPAGQKIKAVTLAEQSLKRKLAYTFLQSRAGYLDPAITPNLIESNRAVERVSIGNCVYKLEVVFKAHCAALESSADGASV